MKVWFWWLVYVIWGNGSPLDESLQVRYTVSGIFSKESAFNVVKSALAVRHLPAGSLSLSHEQEFII